MPSERMKQIERLLDEKEDAIRQEDWCSVGQRAPAALGLEVEKVDARAYLVAARGKART